MQIDQVFNAQLTNLARQNLGVTAGTDYGASLPYVRNWFIPADPVSGATFMADLFAIPAWSLAFNRANLAAMYQAVLSLNGTAGHEMAIRMQCEYLAAMERAFRSRHCSYIRGLVHAGRRRYGHGHLSYGTLARVLAYITQAISRGNI